MKEIKELLLMHLSDMWGNPEFKAEWDGNHFGGGMLSQRYWEYFWAISQINDFPKNCIDIGGGKDLFFYSLLCRELKKRVIAIDPEAPKEVNVFNVDLEDFFRIYDDIEYDHVFCISVLEHVEERDRFCQLLDRFQGKIIMTFELSFKSESPYISRKQMYSFLSKFKNHYVREVEECPILADNSDGTWRPFGVVLEPI